MNYEQILIGAFIAINIFSFLFMAFDKRKAIKGSDATRIPEGLIFCLGTMFGSIGVYAAMLIFRHKTRKWYFQVGIPLLIAQNLTTLYFIKGLINTLNV